MIKITDIQTLGTDYTVADTQGNIIRTIQVIPHTEILDAALGPYDPEQETFTQYLENSIAVLIGFEEVDPYRIYWYATHDEEVVLADLIEYAVKHGYDKIILEHLVDEE
jgi:hypothetical protein